MTTTKQAVKQTEKFRKRRDKFILSGGETISLVKVYTEYKKRAYDIKNRKTGNIIKEKMGGVKEWCSENSFGERDLKRTERVSRDYHRKLFSIVREEKNKFYNGKNEKNNKKFILFADKEPELSDGE